MAKHKDEAQWQLLHNNLLEHKGTMAEFCSQKNINLKTFKNWCYKFRKDHAICHKNNNKKSKFIMLQLPSNDTIKIKLPNGIMVEVSSKNLSMIIKELANAI